MSARCRAAIAAIVVCLAFPGAASAAALEVTGLRLDHRTGELLGVGDPTPVLGWKVAGAGPVAVQTAFQVRVAGSAGALDSGPYLWDSGRVESRETLLTKIAMLFNQPAQQTVNVKNLDLQELALRCAHARFELARLNVARKAKVEGSESLALSKFEGQVKACEEEVAGEKTKMKEQSQLAAGAKEAWDKRKSALARKTFDARASPFVE